MNELVRLSLATCIIGCVAVLLPTAFAGAGGYSCYKCPADQLQPMSQCNTTSEKNQCGDGSSGTCFAATIELMNGTFIGVKDCFSGDNCTSSTACANITIQGDNSFRRCEASCCTPDSCNQYLPASWPPSPTVPPTSNMSITQTPASKDEDPTAASINVKAVYYLPICLLIVVIQIMS